MKKTMTLIFLSIILVLICMYLNFGNFLYGSPVTIGNLIVTFLYIIIWGIILIIGIKDSNYKFMIYSCIFWFIMLLLSILTIYVDATGASASWAIPFAVLLLGQWYGLEFFFSDYLVYYMMLAFSSLVIIINITILIKRKKSV
ncbi:hypothetical protein [Clostridium cellulovorans]|uniref:Uncharacterized protein n=1 Tax=Clostridium cellulovorans (strain ATCC 35296 / DSM 3052 / OCM 3 / 743B) TaxID=573061 RepID=D9SNB5_CLOC7|nr:hypothetical protein [Clostridium cellulovorans]ADL53907.1 hypothetical protein Clocel_4246 [Clostridium cellulovorans 743B]